MLNDQESQRRAQQRETAEPSERSRPIPKLFLIFALAHVLWGAVYIVTTGPFGQPALGDQRTLADLSGPVPGAGGVVDGKKVFSVNCVACHQVNGKGIPAAFAALDGSPNVLGNKAHQIDILLHGQKSGKFPTAMPAWPQLSDTEIAAVITYTRNSWSNKATENIVQPAEVLAARK